MPSKVACHASRLYEPSHAARKAPSGPTINCVDLFSGAGGFSLAAAQAGLKVVLAVEQDRHAAATYRHNFGRGKEAGCLIEADIRSLDAKQICRETASGPGSIRILLGGPPCQGFSSHRLNGSGVPDERNDLIHVYFNFVRALAPTVFLMENVPGMLWPRHGAAVQKFYDEGKDAGYRLFDPAVLDARDFGVGQRRRRVFILGVRRGIDTSHVIWPPAPTHGGASQCEKDPRLVPWLGCADAFRPAPVDDLNDVHMNHCESLTAAFARTPPNGGSRSDSGRTLRCHHEHDGHNDVYGRIDPTKPAPTMTTACINPSKGRFVHPTLHHGITVRQAARIQTFPDAFRFEGGLMAAGRQVGNAVPVALAKTLIEHLKPLLIG